MPPPKFDSSGTHFYATTYHLSPTCIHIVGGAPYHILDIDDDIAVEVREWETGEAPWQWWLYLWWHRGNGLVDNEDFDGFDKNDNVASEADEAYMDTLNKLTGRGNDVAQFLMGEDWDQDLV